MRARDRIVIAAACSIVLGACQFDHGELPDASGSAVADAGATQRPDAFRVACTPWSWVPSNFDPCTVAPTYDGGGLVISGNSSYDTNTGVLVDGSAMQSIPSSTIVMPPGGQPTRIISVATLEIANGATLTVTGDAALLFAVHGNATIDGTIDVSARPETGGASTPGPGAGDSTTCGTSTGRPGSDPAFAIVAGGAPLTGGGGGGGGFGSSGGRGGTGSGDPNAAGGNGGVPSSDTQLIPLRGGCPGGNGGDAGGAGGAGGGALQLSVRDDLSITGKLIAAGAGGMHGTQTGGGSGGGSGGALFLEANRITIKATAQKVAALCANGGSGGEGGAVGQTSGDGTLGSCSESAGATTEALAPAGGNGGGGGYRSSNNGAGSDGGNGGTSGAGGGGGGGAGRIRIRGVMPDVYVGSPVISPQQS